MESLVIPEVVDATIVEVEIEVAANQGMVACEGVTAREVTVAKVVVGEGVAGSRSCSQEGTWCGWLGG